MHFADSGGKRRGCTPQLSDVGRNRRAPEPLRGNFGTNLLPSSDRQRAPEDSDGFRKVRSAIKS